MCFSQQTAVQHGLLVTILLGACVPQATLAGELDDLYDRGRQLGDAGDLPGAIAIYSDILRRAPTYARAYHGRGLAWSFSGHEHAEKAMADLNEAIRLNPRFSASYGARATLQRRQGNFAVALQDANTAVTLEPIAVSYAQRGQVFDAMGQYEKALADYDKSIGLVPTDPVVHFCHAITKTKLGRLEEAMRDINQAVTLAPNESIFYGERACIHSLQGRHRAAVADYSEAVRLDPENAGPYRFPRAWINARFLESDLDQSLEDFRICLNDKSLAAQAWKAYTGIGIIYLLKNHHDLAVENYSRAIQLRPDATACYSLRSRSYAALGRQAESQADMAIAKIIAARAPEGAEDELSEQIQVIRHSLRRVETPSVHTSTLPGWKVAPPAAVPVRPQDTGKERDE